MSPAEVEVEVESKPATAALPETHAHDSNNDDGDDDHDDDDIHFLPDHDDYQCYRETETKTLGQGQKGGDEGIHFAADPNECYRLASSWGMQLRATAVGAVKKDGCVCRGGGGGAGIPLRGEYVTVFDGCDAIDDCDDHCEDGFHDDCLDNDNGSNSNDDDYEDADAEDDDDLPLDLNHGPPPPPPGLLDDNDDLPTAVRRFAWTYAKGLGGLVMGIVDGFAMAAAGAGGG